MPSPDLECDDSLTCASILCFTETWLTPQMVTSCVRGNNQAIRADRTSGNNKGGVLVSLSDNVKVLDSSDVSLEGIAIEILRTALRLPSGQSILLTVVYRSPSVPFEVLLETMVKVLSYLQTCGQGVISIIMGDSNEDLLSKPESQLAIFMAQGGYSQLVHTPTTDNGTLIDHVDCNSPAPECADIHIADLYYSDHNAILCSIPLN